MCSRGKVKLNRLAWRAVRASSGAEHLLSLIFQRAGGGLLRSWPFSLEHGAQHQLLLQRTADGQASGCFLVVRTELRPHAGLWLHFNGYDCVSG